MKHLFTITLILSLWSCTNQSKPKVEDTTPPKTTVVEEEKTPIEEAKPVEIQSFDYSEWTEGAASGDGCSCAFRTEKDNYKTGDVFASNLEKEACIKLDGKVIALKGEVSDELYRNAEFEHWFVFNEKGDHTLFGKKIDFSAADWYNDTKTILKRTLHNVGTLPKDIPMKTNGTVGMGIRGEFRSMAAEAIQEVKAEKKNGNQVIIFEAHYQNDTYDCFIKAYEIGKGDSGSKYEGTMEVKSKDGKVLGTKQVWGGCGC